MVSADFPNINGAQRKQIYDCLTGKGWIKVRDSERDVSTIWYRSFPATVSEDTAINTSRDEFMRCSKLVSTPKLALHFGPNKPTY
jgi:hypothetical protein